MLLGINVGSVLQNNSISAECSCTRDNKSGVWMGWGIRVQLSDCWGLWAPLLLLFACLHHSMVRDIKMLINLVVSWLFILGSIFLLLPEVTCQLENCSSAELWEPLSSLFLLTVHTPILMQSKDFENIPPTLCLNLLFEIAIVEIQQKRQ